MARRVDSLPPDARGSKYPWAEWLDGSVWELRQGEDFDCRPENLRSLASGHVRPDWGVKSRLVGTTLYIQAVPKVPRPSDVRAEQDRLLQALGER